MSSNITHGFRVKRNTGDYVFGFNDQDNLFVAGNVAEAPLANIMVSSEIGTTGQVAYIKDADRNIGWTSDIEINSMLATDVGIGVANPTCALDVSGSAKVSGTLTVGKLAQSTDLGGIPITEHSTNNYFTIRCPENHTSYAFACGMRFQRSTTDKWFMGMDNQSITSFDGEMDTFIIKCRQNQDWSVQYTDTSEQVAFSIKPGSVDSLNNNTTPSASHAANYAACIGINKNIPTCALDVNGDTKLTGQVQIKPPDTTTYTTFGLRIGVDNTSYDTVVNELNVHGNSQGGGKIYVGQSYQYGGGICYMGNDTVSGTTAVNAGSSSDVSKRNQLFARDRVIFFRRHAGTNDYPVLWYGYGSDSIYTKGSITSNQAMAPSDVRLKKNINNLNKSVSLDILSKLQLKEYDYNDSYKDFYNITGKSIGFIANDVKTFLPEACKTVEEDCHLYKLTDRGHYDPNIHSEDSEGGLLTLDTAPIFKHTVNVVQLLVEENQRLKSDMANLVAWASTMGYNQ